MEDGNPRNALPGLPAWLPAPEPHLPSNLQDMEGLAAGTQAAPSESDGDRQVPQ